MPPRTGARPLRLLWTDALVIKRRGAARGCRDWVTSLFRGRLMRRHGFCGTQLPREASGRAARLGLFGRGKLMLVDKSWWNFRGRGCELWKELSENFI